MPDSVDSPAPLRTTTPPRRTSPLNRSTGPLLLASGPLPPRARDGAHTSAGRGRIVGAMGLVSKFNAWRRKLQEQPGTTIDLEPMQALLPLIEEREAELSELTDDELRAAATALHQREDPQDFVEACAL